MLLERNPIKLNPEGFPNQSETDSNYLPGGGRQI